MIKFTALVLYFTYNSWLIVRFDWGNIYCSINEGLVGFVMVEMGDQWALSLVLSSRKDWWQQREGFYTKFTGKFNSFCLEMMKDLHADESWRLMGGSWGLMEVFLVSCPVFKALKMALFLGNGITVHKWDNLPSPALRGSLVPCFPNQEGFFAHSLHT